MKLTVEEFDKFLARLTLNIKEKSELRIGQAMYNALYYVKPELAESLGDVDPFYHDSRITAFINHIKP